MNHLISEREDSLEKHKYLRNLEAENGRKWREVPIDKPAPFVEHYIEFLKTQLAAYEKKAAGKPEFKAYVWEIEDEIEAAEDELSTLLNNNEKT